MKKIYMIFLTTVMALLGISSCHPIEVVEPEEEVGMEDGLVYISKSFAGQAETGLHELYPQMATMKVSTTLDGRKNISLHYEFTPLDWSENIKGGNTSLDLELDNLQYKDTTGYFFLSEKNISTELRLGCFEEPLPFKNVSVEGTVGIDDYKKGTELLISGEVEEEFFMLRVSMVTADFDKSGLPKSLYVGTHYEYLYGVSLRNETTSDIDLEFKKRDWVFDNIIAEEVHETIKPGESFYIQDFISIWSRYTDFSFTAANVYKTILSLEPLIENGVIRHFYLSGLESEESEDYFITVLEGCVAPFYIPVDNYTLTEELFQTD